MNPFCFHYDITSLRNARWNCVSRAQPASRKCYTIQSIVPAQDKGSYKIHLKDKGIRLTHKEQVVLCLITSQGPVMEKTMITTRAFEVISSLSQAGISAFSFTKSQIRHWMPMWS